MASRLNMNNLTKIKSFIIYDEFTSSTGTEFLTSISLLPQQKCMRKYHDHLHWYIDPDPAHLYLPMFIAVILLNLYTRDSLQQVSDAVSDIPMRGKKSVIVEYALKFYKCAVGQRIDICIWETSPDIISECSKFAVGTGPQTHQQKVEEMIREFLKQQGTASETNTHSSIYDAIGDKMIEHLKNSGTHYDFDSKTLGLIEPLLTTRQLTAHDRLKAICDFLRLRWTGKAILVLAESKIGINTECYKTINYLIKAKDTGDRLLVDSATTAAEEERKRFIMVYHNYMDYAKSDGDDKFPIRMELTVKKHWPDNDQTGQDISNTFSALRKHIEGSSDKSLDLSIGKILSIPIITTNIVSSTLANFDPFCYMAST
ncbi:hypothetical protein RF11_06466 [Thelohanellus kitauei]|uniref:Uncharacterized protein n=1 Tax=Thelohanellus kitauei TaxID=669202 RepID=A0A0C2IWP6_THEKT|nr:hypothetical protein RF11_06466 [Thelohanellus kitauei]